MIIFHHGTHITYNIITLLNRLKFGFSLHICYSSLSFSTKLRSTMLVNFCDGNAGNCFENIVLIDGTLAFGSVRMNVVFIISP